MKSFSIPDGNCSYCISLTVMNFFPSIASIYFEILTFCTFYIVVRAIVRSDYDNFVVKFIKGLWIAWGFCTTDWDWVVLDMVFWLVFKEGLFWTMLDWDELEAVWDELPVDWDELPVDWDVPELTVGCDGTVPDCIVATIDWEEVELGWVDCEGLKLICDEPAVDWDELTLTPDEFAVIWDELVAGCVLLRTGWEVEGLVWTFGVCELVFDGVEFCIMVFCGGSWFDRICFCY